jgi:Na+/H+ antiporter NhaD/arsenite permease-like protein
MVTGLPATCPAATGSAEVPGFTDHWVGLVCLGIFVAAYVLVVIEERIHMRKSKPVMVAAGIIWILVAMLYAGAGQLDAAREAVMHNLTEYGELLFFLLAAMTYVNAMEERGVFDSLRAWLVSRGFSLRSVFWITGALAFVISPLADNLTTALLMATVVMAVGGSQRGFISLGCINIVVAANAGGAFSPFGDITTLMVWQKGLVGFGEFLALFFPSLVNWLVPALLMAAAVPKRRPEAVEGDASLLPGAWAIMGLFGVTIAMAVTAHNFLHLPPVMGMMTGLGLLLVVSHFLGVRIHRFPAPEDSGPDSAQGPVTHIDRIDIFRALQRAEWDTLMFFYGIILAVGGLAALGYLALASDLMYGTLGASTSNVLVGLLSAIVDNIPVMFAVLSMQPDMDLGQWLLVTLTAGVGGSLLATGSAAGVAVLGQARGIYTFLSHLKWTWAIALGYGAAIALHFWLNARLFSA